MSQFEKSHLDNFLSTSLRSIKAGGASNLENIKASLIILVEF